MSALTDVLSKIGFTENELKVYEVIVAFNFRTIGQISSYTNLDLITIQDACDKLIDKNYLKKKEYKSSQAAIYIPLSPKIAITSNVSKNLSSKLQSLSDKINDIWQSAQGNIDSDIGNLISSAKDALENLQNTLDRYKDEHTDAVSRSNESFQTNLQKVTNKTSEIFQTKITDPISSLSKELTKISKQIITICDKSIESISQANETHKAQILNTSSKIKEEVETLIDAIGLFSSGRISALSKKTDVSSSEATKALSNLVNEMNSSVEIIVSQDIENINNFKDQFPSNMLEAFDNQKEIINKLINQINTKFAKAVESAVAANNKAVKESIMASNKMITYVDANQKTHLENLQKEMLKAIKTVQSEAIQNLNDVLTETSNGLSKQNKNTTKSLEKHELKLNSDLNALRDSLTTSLAEKFTNIEEKLTTFVSNLKNSSEDNVKNIVGSVNELKDHFNDFLSNTQVELSNNLDSLNKDVKKSMKKIVFESDVELTASNTDKNDQLTTRNEKITLDLQGFQTDFDEFLNNIKNELQTNLQSGQGVFKEEVEVGLTTFQLESKKLADLQLEQIKELENDSKNLLSITQTARDDINEFLNSELSEIKQSNISELNIEVKSAVDTFSDNCKRFNENMDQEFKQFYNTFHDNSSGLREEVPEKIEGLLIDQSDRLDNFRRDFARIIGHANDTLNNFLMAFSSDGKKIDKKKVQALHGNVTRAVQDFTYFDQQIGEHFRKSIEDTDQVKSEFLNEINKIIQNQLSDLEQIVSVQSSKAMDVTKDFLVILKDDASNFTHNIDSNTEEKMSVVQSNISTQLLEKFQLPLTNILSKAKNLATGTEGGENENRIIVTQNQLIKSIKDAMKELSKTLQSSFLDSIADLDVNVDKTKVKAHKIIEKLIKQLNVMFKGQKKDSQDFVNKLKTSLSTLQTKINDTLNKSITSTNKKVDTTIQVKSAEVIDLVSERTNELMSATSDNIIKLDEALTEFNLEFKGILSTTSESVSSTVDEATSAQNKSMQLTIKSLNSTTKSAQNTINSTKKTLDEKVTLPMNQVDSEVTALVKNYTLSLKEGEESLNKEIQNYYGATSKYIKQLNGLKKTFEGVKSTYEKDIENVSISLGESLSTYLNMNIEARTQNVSKFEKEISAKIKEIEDNNTSFVLNTFDEVKTQLSILQVEIDEQVTTTKESIEIEVTNTIESVRTDILLASEKITTTLANEKVDSPTKIKAISKSLSNLTDSQDSGFIKAKDEFLAKVSHEVTSRGDEWKTNIIKGYDKQNQSLSSLFDSFKDEVEKFSSSGKEKVTTAINKIPSTIEETLDAAAKSMSLLNEISKGSLELEAKFPELSYFDASKEAIIANLNGVISRTKASITIVAPTISWLDENLIQKLNRVSVKIITDLTKHTPDDKRILDLFNNHGINLDLRKLDKNRYRGEIDLIMATRDREEVMLSKLLESPHPYAFVSQDESFIEKFTELFAPFQTMPRVS